MRNISNSEVTSFLTCKRMYNFAFIEELTPVASSDPLDRGTLGHLAFEYYVQARLNGSKHDQAMKAGLYAFEEATRQNLVRLDIILQTQLLWTDYMNFHQGWPDLKMLGTEERLDLKITDTINMTIRYDLYVENLNTGQRAIGDYKFTWDFWSVEDHDLNAQMPKYITVMNLNDRQVDYGFLEEIRTRPLGKDKASDPKNKWRRTIYRPSTFKKRAMMKQHVMTAMQIEEHRALTPEARNEASIPVLNKHGACKYCSFKDLCNSMNDGATDLTLMIQSKYKKNTYGYNKTDDILGELQ